ncbi:competence protein CoiA family protein [Streptomyces sp. NPDC001212]
MSGAGASGSRRADVLASTATGRRVALEAQLANITAADIRARTERMRTAGVRSCWFSDRNRIPWLGIVPLVRVTRQEGGLIAVLSTSGLGSPSRPVSRTRCMSSRPIERSSAAQVSQLRPA